jgi:hypothetical protein
VSSDDPTNVVTTLALFLVLPGGTAVAAAQLGKNSVGRRTRLLPDDLLLILAASRADEAAEQVSRT